MPARAMALATIALLSFWVGVAGAQQPAAGAQGRIGVLLAAGDIAQCRRDRDGRIVDAGRAAATAELLGAEIAAAEADGVPVRVLALGDLAYPSGTRADFACFEASWGRYAGRLLPVPGNHEHRRPNPDAAPYYEFFGGNPLVSANGPRTGYYSLRFPDPARGPWLLIALNPYLPDAGARARQAAWLERELAPAEPRCVLAFWHPPLFSSGLHGHGDSDDLDEPVCRPDDARAICRGTGMMLGAYRALYDRGASVVLAGHDHHFEQFGRLDPMGRPDPKGLRSFVVGTGGARLRRHAYARRWPSEAYSHDSHGILRLDLLPDRYTWRFIPVAGAREVPIPEDRRADSCNGRR